MDKQPKRILKYQKIKHSNNMNSLYDGLTNGVTGILIGVLYITVLYFLE